MIISNWKEKIARSYIWGDASKNIILFLSTLISFASLLLSVGFYYGANQVVDMTQERIVDSTLFKATKKERISSGDAPLSLIKVTRPKRDDLSFLSGIVNSAIVTDDFTKVFPGNHDLFFHDKRIEDPVFSPVYSYLHLRQKSELLIEGTIPDQETMEEVVINKTFAAILSTNFHNLVGQKLAIDIKTKITIDDEYNSVIEDVFLWQKEIKISGIFEELSFLNTPKIFYSHVALEKLLENYYLEDMSDHWGEDISCLDIFRIIADNHYLTNYDLNVFVLSKDDLVIAAEISKKLESSGSNMALESSSLLIKNTYQELTKAAFYSMLVFLVIALVGTCSIMAIGAYSNYVSKKKESAILTSIGARKTDVLDIFLYKNLFIIFAAIIAAFAFAIFAQKIANDYFYKHFMFKNLIDIPLAAFMGRPFFLIFIVLSFGYVITLVFTYLPLRLYKGLSLADELREN